METQPDKLKATRLSRNVLPQGPRMSAAVPEIEELEESVVSLVHAELVAGATSKEVRDFYKGYMEGSLVQPRARGEEWLQFCSASIKVRTKYGSNWRTFLEDYFEGAIHSFESISKSPEEQSEVA